MIEKGNPLYTTWQRLLMDEVVRRWVRNASDWQREPWCQQDWLIDWVRLNVPPNTLQVRWDVKPYSINQSILLACCTDMIGIHTTSCALLFFACIPISTHIVAGRILPCRCCRYGQAHFDQWILLGDVHCWMQQLQLVRTLWMHMINCSSYNNSSSGGTSWWSMVLSGLSHLAVSNVCSICLLATHYHWELQLTAGSQVMHCLLHIFHHETSCGMMDIKMVSK